MTASAPAPALAHTQRRAVPVLMVSQVLGGVGIASGLAVGGVLAADVSGSTTLSGLAVTATVLGAALAALPLARLTTARGRRPGLAVGWTVAAVGAGLLVLAAVARSFALLMTGALLFGAAAAAGLQSRYAATDCAEPAHRARALSLVVWATTVGAVLGPNLVGPGGAVARALGLPDLAGPFVLSTLVFLAGAAVLVFLLRPDPLLTARAAANVGAATPGHAKLRTSLTVVRGSPPAVLGLTSVVLGHAVMVSIMAMTPVHMHEGGAELRLVGLVISVHIAGMYAFSPVVGWFTDRVGEVRVILLGQGLFLAAVATAGMSAHSSTALGIGLFLLGLGWSCTLVAGSTLLSASVPLSDRPGVQGASDFLMNLLAAAGGAASGLLLSWLGYGGLNAVTAVLVLPVLVLAVGGGDGRPGGVPRQRRRSRVGRGRALTWGPADRR